MTWSAMHDAQRYAVQLMKGERIRLRPVTEADLDLLVAWWSDPAWAVLQQLVVRPGPAEAARDQFRRWSSNDSPGDVGFAVEDLSTEQLVGHVTLYGASLPARAGTLAVMIGSEYVGQGFGSDAVRVLTSYGFREMGLNRIELRTLTLNTRARAAYEKVGYVVEGIRRAVVFHDGRFHDEVLMSVLAGEWQD